MNKEEKEKIKNEIIKQDNIITLKLFGLKKSDIYIYSKKKIFAIRVKENMDDKDVKKVLRKLNYKEINKKDRKPWMDNYNGVYYFKREK